MGSRLDRKVNAERMKKQESRTNSANSRMRKQDRTLLSRLMAYRGGIILGGGETQRMSVEIGEGDGI